MPITLPPAVIAYFALSNGDPAVQVEDCFSKDAVVTDEHQQHQGMEAIRQWLAQTRKAYEFQAMPVKFLQHDDRVSVEVRVTGNFPGGAVSLDYVFMLSEGKIRTLLIK
ncbi:MULTISPECIES: nuclear transport factor 2 family protein [Stenotrophomonas]|uniref:nuclear transport factor 2 family protein n=1 Tax=Stenotrophomonas TaxID=40323 RepID=UPI00077063DC|nr:MULTISPECIES: nuclear transport factor 2 family protein [Stenotrophomonas]AMJ56327.1 hypothetical protein AXG53_06440 [Stenotrophomonas sp. KCTC 12332]